MTVIDARIPRVAVVTGASRGIGRAVALRLARDGHSVVVNYHSRKDAADAVVAEIAAVYGQTAIAVQADAGSEHDLLGLLDAAEQHFGGIDVLVHNAAGICAGPIAQATDDEFDRSFGINARGTFVLLRQVAHRVRLGGRVVVVSSIATRIPATDIGLYAASKAAAEHLVRVFAREVGSRGVTVNCVLPGPTRSEELPGGK